MITEIKNVITVIKGTLTGMEKGQKRRILLIGASGIILLTIDIVFVFLPLVNMSFRLRGQIISVKDNISSLGKQVSAQNAAKDKLAALKNDQARYKNIFPKEGEIPILVGDISNIAGKVGVEIIAVKPVRVEPDTGQTEKGIFYEAPIEIAAKGGYHQIGQFTNKLETFDKFLEIKDVEISADKTQPRRHFFRLLVATYILKG